MDSNRLILSNTMDTQGFYKKDGTGILFSPEIVEGNSYMLLSSERENYSYPIDGWVWAENLDGAINFFANEPKETSAPFFVSPEGYFLATSREDETEFNKLATLTQLMISQGKLLPSTVIKIRDNNGQPHAITVSRLLDAISDYGMFCFLLRN